MNDPEFKTFTKEDLNPLPKVTGPFFGYAVGMMEYERGWGSKHDGYLIFSTEQDAKAYIHNETKDRDGPVPDYYVSYNVIGWQQVSEAIMSKMLKNGRTYVDLLSELK